MVRRIKSDVNETASGKEEKSLPKTRIARLFQGDIESHFTETSIEEASVEGNFMIPAEGSAILNKVSKKNCVHLFYSFARDFKIFHVFERCATFQKKSINFAFSFSANGSSSKRQMLAKITLCCDDFFSLCRKSRCKPRLYTRKCCQRS